MCVCVCDMCVSFSIVCVRVKNIMYYMYICMYRAAVLYYKRACLLAAAATGVAYVPCCVLPCVVRAYRSSSSPPPPSPCVLCGVCAPRRTVMAAIVVCYDARVCFVETQSHRETHSYQSNSNSKQQQQHQQQRLLHRDLHTHLHLSSHAHVTSSRLTRPPERQPR